MEGAIRRQVQNEAKISGIILLRDWSCLMVYVLLRGLRYWQGDLQNLYRKEAYVMPLQKEVKTKAIEDFHRHEKDTGSPEVQIAILTNRITQLTEHLRSNKQDQSCRRGLLKLVGSRRRLLTYLRQSNYQSYLSVTERLNLRRK